MESFDFDYNYNFSRLSAIELQRQKITFGEIISVFENPMTSTIPFVGYQPKDFFYGLIGFSDKKRFLLVALNYEEDRVNFIQIDVADENQIREFYCGR